MVDGVLLDTAMFLAGRYGHRMGTVEIAMTDGVLLDIAMFPAGRYGQRMGTVETATVDAGRAGGEATICRW